MKPILMATKSQDTCLTDEIYGNVEWKVLPELV